MKRLLAALLALLLAVVLTACENNTDKSSGKTSGTATTVAAENTWQTKLEDILKAENFNGVVRVSQNGKVLCEAAHGKKAQEKRGRVVENGKKDGKPDKSVAGFLTMGWKCVKLLPTLKKSLYYLYL
jgi:hypothetical protein